MPGTSIRVALRRIKRNPVQQAITLLGFTVGLAACLLIGSYAIDELRYDTSHPDADRIYTVYVEQTNPLHVQIFGKHVGVTSAQLAPALADIPGVAAASRYWPDYSTTVLVDEQPIELDGMALVDPGFLDVYSIPVQMGSREQMLTAPQTLLLTRSGAGRLFGELDPVGQSVHFQDGRSYTVAGVIDDPPELSHLVYEALLTTQGDVRIERFRGKFLTTYLKLTDQTDPLAVEAALNQKVETITDEPIRYHLQPLSHIHLNVEGLNFSNARNTTQPAFVFGPIWFGIIVLVLAMLNYINLATLELFTRDREVGVRRTLGATASQLIRQFLVEGILIVSLSMIGAIVVAYTAAPFAKQIAGRPIELSNLLAFPTVLAVVLFPVVVGVLAAILPAWILARIEATRALKRSVSRHRGGAMLRRGFAVLQFATTIVFLVAVGVIHQQMSYVNSMDLGFSRDHVMALDIPHGAQDKAPGLLHEINALPGVAAAGLVERMPFQGWSQSDTRPDGTFEEDQFPTYFIPVDAGNLDVMKYHLLAGQFFSKDVPVDVGESQQGIVPAVVNESYVKSANWETPVGERFWQDETEYTVIGVVEDYHHMSLYNPIKPTVMVPINEAHVSSICIRYREPLDKTLPAIRAAWNTILPQYTMNYEFLDDIFSESYRDQYRIMHVLQAMVVIAVSVALLGLFGLTLFFANKRRRELAIRKVFGAGRLQLVQNLIRETGWIVGLALLIAWPVTIPVERYLLEPFAFRTELPWWLTGLAGMMVFVVSLAIASTVAWHAASVRPIQVLREE